MPISTKVRKQQQVKPFAIDIDGETLAGTFRPGVVTFGWSRELQNIGKATKDTEDSPVDGGTAAKAVPDDPATDKALIGKILELVASWDLEDEPGQPLPLTEDALMDVPTSILTATLRGVIKAASDQGEAQAGTTPAKSADFS